MSFDASQITSQLDRIFNFGYRLIETLNNAGVKFDKEAILYHNSRTLQFKYSLNIKMNTSIPRKIARKFKSKLAKELAIPSDGEVYAIPYEDTSPYVKERGNQKIIDIPAMLKGLSSSNDIFIIFSERLSEQQTKAIFDIPHAIRDPNYRDHYRIQEKHIEIICDFGRYYNKHYDSFKIRDVKQTGATTFHKYDVINKLLPPDLRNIVNEAERARSLDGEMMRQLQSISNTFRRFETDEDIQDRLSRAFSTDKPENILIDEVQGKVTEHDILGRKLVIPSRVEYTTDLRIEGKQVVISAKLVIDNGEIEAVIRELAEEIRV
jgi:hypothetical protein